MASTFSHAELKQTEQQYTVLRALELYKAAELEKYIAMAKLRPSRFLPVLVYHDGLRWVCSFGNLIGLPPGVIPPEAEGSSGVEAYGASPEEATQNFDRMWLGDGV